MCSGCGRPRDETMVHEDNAPFYDVISLACHACKARDLASRDAVDTNGVPPPGRYYSVTPRDDYTPPGSGQQVGSVSQAV